MINYKQQENLQAGDPASVVLVLFVEKTQEENKINEKEIKEQTKMTWRPDIKPLTINSLTLKQSP